MRIICVDTNATVEGWRIPVGEYNYPLEGVLAVTTSGGVSTNLVCGSSGTLLIEPTRAGVIEGTDVWHFVVLGFLLSFGYLGLIGAARRIARTLSGGQVREV